MKKILILCFFVFANFIANSQTIMVSGKVNDKDGKVVPFAFVRDAKNNNATYTNAEGLFSLKADAASSLIASAVDFIEASVEIANKHEINITLTPNVDGAVKKKSNRESDFFQTSTNNQITTTGSQYLRSQKDEVHGSRYLSDKWEHGYAVNSKDSLIQHDEYLYNYDKMSGDLLFTSNQRAIYTANKNQAKLFIIFDENGQSVTYEHVPEISPNQYVKVIASGKKYKIYNHVITRFIKSNYTTNGITSSGNTYDEYADENNYYVVQTGEKPKKIALKKKALKLAFVADADRINKFLSENDGDIDDNYLKNLGEYMNQ